MSRIQSLFAAVIVAASFAAPAAEPIKIGVSGPYTGGTAFMGVSMRDGARLAVTEINARGGILGRPILLVERDDENKRDRYLQVAQELIEKEKVAATVGFINTVYAQTSHALYQAAKVPALTNVATGAVLATQFHAPQYAENYIFKTTPNDEIQGELIVEEAVGRRKLRKVAILVDASDYGQMGQQLLERELQKWGLKAVAIERLDPKGDIATGLANLKKAAPDVILVYGYASGIGKIAGGMEKIGLKAPLIGPWTLSMPDFISSAGGNGEGAVMTQTFIQDGNTVRRKAFIDAYLNAFNPPNRRIPSPMSAAQGYDSVYLLAAAIRQAGTTDGPKIREALESLDEKVEGVIATYQRPFSRADHEAITKSMLVMGRVRGGQVVAAQ